MKRRVVAIVLSLTLCMGGTLEAGAAALGSTEVQSAETGTDVTEDSFGDEAETVQQPQTDEEQTDTVDGDAAEDVPGDATETPDITVTPDATETPDITETPDTTETPEEDTTTPADEFSAGEVQELEDESAKNAKAQNADAGTAVAASSEGAELVDGVVIAKSSDWESSDMGFRLIKKTTSDETVPAAETENQTDSSAEVTPAAVDGDTADNSDVADTTVTEDTQESVQPETSGETAETESETEAVTAEDLTLDDSEAAEAETAATTATTTASEKSYFTSADGLLKINTDGHIGYYLFNEDGYLETGRMTREPGMDGYKGTKKVEWYFLEKDKATLYAGCEGQPITPWTSDFGQQQRKYWLWTGKTFRYYSSAGNYMTVEERNIYGKVWKIGNDYYTLAKSGAPRVGTIKLTTGSTTYEYYFKPASKTGDIPGKLFYGGWTYVLNSKNEKRFIYCSPKSSTRGQIMKHGVYVSMVMSKKYLYMLNSSGYVMKSTMAKAENQKNAYYITDSNGRVIKQKLVKYKGYRYYFGSDGKRVTWKNCWHSCPGASNKIYYFGSTAGRVVEKYGWQKVTDSKGKFFGWYYFDSKGNHYKSQMLTAKSSGKSYYFNSTGQLVSGKTKIGSKYYFFATSDSKTHRGWMYKSTLIRYQNKWYYADKNGVLKKSGWQKSGKYWYYFSNYTAVTNKSMKRGSVNGYLDSQGRFSTGWVIFSDYYDQVKYIDPDTGSKYLTNTKRWIDGKLYYFDKNGYRRNDLTSIYKGPYYLEVDKTNGVMTVYTDSSKKIPVKTIRVSVGLAATPTWDGTYRLSRSLRWQPLMGPSWGQYGTHVDGCGQGGIFIHSVAGATKSVYNLPAGEYLKLGEPASHGCIRTCVADAKWVYENCNGSTIHIYSSGKYSSNESFKGPLGRRPLATFRGNGSFDPTDPEVP